MNYNPNSTLPAYVTIRYTISNDELIAAIEDMRIATGMDHYELAREALIEYLAERELVTLEPSNN